MDPKIKRRFYFVRHGQSVFNAQQLHQHADVALSEKGKAQAETVAKRFATLPVELIVSSSHLRAVQTARIIANLINKPVQTSPLFGELRRPSAVIGKPYDDPQALNIRAELEDNFHKKGWRHSDEENCEDIICRATDALTLLLKLPHDHVLVVTHGTFLTALLALMAFGDKLTSREVLAIKKLAYLTNTGITICDYLGDRWRLVTLNDYAHLG